MVNAKGKWVKVGKSVGIAAAGTLVKLCQVLVSIREGEQERDIDKSHQESKI